MESIGQKIKDLRNRLGMTQDELAQKVGYSSRTTINKVEKGVIDLSESKIMAFAKALNATPAFLLGLNDKNDNNNVYIEYVVHPEEDLVLEYKTIKKQMDTDLYKNAPPEAKKMLNAMLESVEKSLKEFHKK